MSQNSFGKGKKSRNRSIKWFFMYLLAIIQLFPFLWVVNFSLVKDSEVFGTSIFKMPNPPMWENYMVAWRDGNVFRYSLNSLLVTSVTIMITVFLSLTLGYAFCRMKWRFRSMFLTMIMLGMMIPIHTTLIPNFLIYSKIGLTNSYWGLIIPYSAFALPLGVYLMTGFMASIPRSLEEAAVVDGCGIYRIIIQIVLPITKPAVVTIAVITFLSCWNEFIIAATYLNNESLRTLPFSVFNFTGQYSSRYAVQFAVMTLSAIPALIFYAILNEQITKGVTMGAVKG